MGCSGSRVSPVEVTSPGVHGAADRVVTSQQGPENREVHNDVPNFPRGTIADESYQDSSNARASVTERSMRMTDGVNRPAVVPVRGSVEGTLAANERQASTEFTAEVKDSRALRETDDVATLEKRRGVQSIAVQPSTSKGKVLRSADHSKSDGASQASFQSVRDKVATTIDGNRKNNREAVIATDRHVRHQDTSTTDLQPDRAMRGKSPDVVYKDRIVEVEKIVHVDRVVSVPVYKDKIVEKIVHVQVPQVSDLDMVVQAAKYLEHTLRVNFSASGDGLGQCIRSASSTHGRFEQQLWKSMQLIVTQRNAIVHEAEINQIHDRRSFMKLFKFVWLSLKKISSCRDYCEVCNNAGLFLSNT